jgi:hypothetical protein
MRRQPKYDRVKSRWNYIPTKCSKYFNDCKLFEESNQTDKDKLDIDSKYQCNDME